MTQSTESFQTPVDELAAFVETAAADDLAALVALTRTLAARRAGTSPPTASEAGDDIEALRRRAAYGGRVELVNKLNLELGAIHDLPLLYELTAKYVRLVFPQIGRASIALVDPSGDTVQLFALDGSPGTVPKGAALPIDGTVVGRTIIERRPLLTRAERPQEHPLLDVRAMGKLGFHAILTAPLIRGREVLGTVNTAAVDMHAYTSEDELLLTQVAATLAVNLERWQLVEQLNDSLERLQRANEELKTELDERVRANQAVVERERVIEEQHRQLLAMATPIIPITQRVVAMPLVGSLGATRAQQVLELALRGVHASHIDTVILDITGLERIDHEVASTLLHMTRALRLLGCGTMLTGVRAEVARTLVELNIDVSGMAIHATLQSAIAASLTPANREGVGRAGPR